MGEGREGEGFDKWGRTEEGEGWEGEAVISK